MLERRTWGGHLFDGFNVVLMILLSAVTLYPLLYVVFASMSDPGQLMQARGLLLFPAGFSLDAYRAVLHNPMILSSYWNTLIYVVTGTAINMAMTCLAAYALSRKNVFWNHPVMIMIVITMFFQGGLIPTYLLVKNLGMIDTMWALVLPPAMSAWNMIIMRTAFQNVPVSLEESARLDGANDFTILMRIVIPLSLPVLAVMVLFYGVAHWNSWFSALIYLRTRDLYPLQMVLREILIQNDTNSMMKAFESDRLAIGETIKYATIIVATIPILVLYPFLQKYFVKGVLIGSLKE